MMVEYELVRKEYRECVDLREFTAEIELSIHNIAPDVKVLVFKDYYSLSRPLHDEEARKIGREISKNCIELSELKTKYEPKKENGTTSTQIFRRREVS